jgi:hypothetical protein
MFDRAAADAAAAYRRASDRMPTPAQAVAALAAAAAATVDGGAWVSLRAEPGFL